MTLTPDQSADVAKQLASATRNGQLSESYALLRKLPRVDLVQIAMRAGFSVLPGRGIRENQTFIQGQVAQACRKRTDGFGLRAGASA